MWTNNPVKSSTTMDMVENFVNNRAPQIDSAWDSALTKFNKDKFQASLEAKQRTSRYKRFISEFVSTSSDTETGSFEVNKRHTWGDVQAEIDVAVQDYNKAIRWTKNPFRRFGRSFSDNSSAMAVFLDLLPSGDYSFVFCGALKLIFGAANRIGKIRETVFACLAGLPMVVETTKNYLKLYRDNPDLRQYAEDLYFTILEAVEDMTVWFNEKGYKKVCKALFRQDKYGEALEQKITADIDKASQQFLNHANYCFQSKLLTSQSEDQKSLIELLKGIQRDGSYMISFLRGEMGPVTQGYLHLTQVVQPVAYAAAPPCSVSVGDLLSLCDLDTSVISDDIEQAFLQGHSLRLSQQTRAAAVFQDPVFVGWLKSSMSQILSVEASEEGSSTAISSATHASVLLWQSLQSLGRTEPMIPLLFICGLHTSENDPLQGAQGIVRSFIAQLLLAHGSSFDFTFVTPHLCQGLENGDMDAYLYLLRGLLRSIRHGTLVIILDGISWVETDDRKLGTYKLVHGLQSLVQEIRAAPISLALKVLFTSPSRSLYISDWLTDFQAIRLPTSISNRGKRFTQAHVDDQTGVLGSSGSDV